MGYGRVEQALNSMTMGENVVLALILLFPFFCILLVIMLLIKIWVMTNDVARIRHLLESRLTSDDDGIHNVRSAQPADD